MDNKKIGIILILSGVGIFFISILFSTGTTSTKFTMMKNLSRMEIVFREEIKERNIYNDDATIDPYEFYLSRFDKEPQSKIAIPTKYLLSFSIIIVLIGTGYIWLPKKD